MTRDFVYAVYVAGYVWFWRWQVWALVSPWRERPETDEIIFGLFMGSLANLLWPLIQLWRLGTARGLDPANVLMPRSERRRRQIKRLEREAEDRERRIRWLERDVLSPDERAAVFAPPENPSNKSP